jgi:3D (Asp-Asp-Asp) domain-containing protein
VDRRRIRLGSVLFIPAAKGLLLPDGSIHDGIFLADDVGSAVRGNKIDFFVGFDHHTSNLFTATKRILHARRVEVYVVPNDLAERVAARHRGAGAPLRVE